MNRGIVMYSIEGDGCLNGVFTNPGAFGRILNEVARRRGGPLATLEGDYDCFYFDSDDSRNDCTLTISIDPTTRQFTLRWIGLDGVTWFEGRGFRMNDRTLVAHYWSV
jgi:hypothetical protein